MGSLLTTEQVCAPERLAFWIDAICDTYVMLECDPLDDRQAFNGSIQHHQLSSLELSRVNASAQRVRHTKRQIAKATEDYFLVSIQTQGRGVVRQDGRDAVLAPGDFALYDSTRPYELYFEQQFEQVVLMLPGSALRSQLSGTDRMTATTVCGQRGAGHLMISMIETLQREVANFEPASAAAVAESVVSILVAGLRTLPVLSSPDASELMLLHREQIKAFVRAHLRDPSLSIALIAHSLRLSVSTVHRAFTGQPMSLSQWLWGLRLDAIKSELVDIVNQHRSASDIVFSWGFNDAAHFSRAFKERFELSPRAFRQRSRDLMDSALPTLNSQV